MLKRFWNFSTIFIRVGDFEALTLSDFEALRNFGALGRRGFEKLFCANTEISSTSDFEAQADFKRQRILKTS